jgi:hypothetical protein
VLYVVSLIGTPLGMLAVDAVGGMPLLAVVATCLSACGTSLLGFDSPFGVLTNPAWSKVLFAGLLMLGLAQVLLHPFLYPMLATLVATKHFFVFRALVLCLLHANTLAAHVTFGAITHMDASYWWFFLALVLMAIVCIGVAAGIWFVDQFSTLPENRLSRPGLAFGVMYHDASADSYTRVSEADDGLELGDGDELLDDDDDAVFDGGSVDQGGDRSSERSRGPRGGMGTAHSQRTTAAGGDRDAHWVDTELAI